MTAFAQILLAVAAVGLHAPAAQPEGPTLHARPTLLAESRSAPPGGTVWIAVDFEIEERWHTYWPGQNDSGVPLSATFETSPNARVGDPLWPAPKRYFPADGIMDHVFEERMTVLFPLTVAEDARPGETVSISADLRWLVCERICLPESASLTLSLPVEAGTPQVNPDGVEAFRDARARLPRPPKEDDQIHISMVANVLRIEAMGSARLAFYPLEDSRRARRLIDQGEAEGEVLEIEFRESEDPIRGVLECWKRPDGASTLLQIEWPEPAEANESRPGP